MVRHAGACRAAGRLDIAATMAEQARDRARRSGYRVFEGQALTVLAEVHLDQGERGPARHLAGQAVRIQAETGRLLGRERAEAVADRAR
jgi:hypothetical protein